MEEQTPSRTAWRVAARRAAHQVFDRPTVFDDPLALRILGPDASTLTADSERENTRIARALRAFMAVRSRFAEDELAQAVARGVRQYVVLGAGLDTFAYRNPFSEGLRVFEVDHPATQAWKRELLARAEIPVPGTLSYVPVNFEQQTLADALQRGGLGPDQPAFFSWLGVTMYLTREAALGVFGFIASRPVGSGVVFDYAVSPSLLGPMERWAVDAFSRRVAAIGEPWTLFFDPSDLGAELRTLGFSEVADYSPDAINARYFSGRTDGLRVGSIGRLMKALR